MSELDKIRILITNGDNAKAVAILSSILQENRNNIDAWLLLGDTIDDPSKKRDCYNQVLRLSPSNTLALVGLRELGDPPPVRQLKPTFKIASPDDDPWAEFREKSKHISNGKSDSEINNTTDNATADQNNVKYIIWGIVAILGVLYVVGASSDSSSDSNPICTGAICLSLVAGIFVWYLSNENRSKSVNNAIQEQRQSSSIKDTYPKEDSGSREHSALSQTVPCRVCQHKVSRTAPSCPNCGELYPGLIAKCPQCNSSNIRITPKGFSLGKAAAGAILAGPLGVAGGLHGRKDLEIKCSNCNRVTTIKNNEIR